VAVHSLLEGALHDNQAGTHSRVVACCSPQAVGHGTD
jgi:hypothetical protein